MIYVLGFGCGLVCSGVVAMREIHSSMGVACLLNLQ